MLIVNQKKSEVYNIQMMKCLYVSHSGDWFFYQHGSFRRRKCNLRGF